MLNKRGLPTAMSVPELTKQLRKKGEPILEGVAIQGLGVFETLKEVAKLVLAELKKGGERSRARSFPKFSSQYNYIETFSLECVCLCEVGEGGGFGFEGGAGFER